MSIQDGVIEDFPIIIGLHQRSTLSSYLFILVLGVLVEHIQDLVSRCMLFTDDIFLVEELREELNRKLALWKQAL